MKIEQINYFLVICKCLNFTKAAESLFVTQPYLSKQISALEKELGVELFVRNPKSVTLTAQGEYLQRMWSAPYKMITDAAAQAQTITDGQHVRLTVGVLAGEKIDQKVISAIMKTNEINSNLSIFFENVTYSKLRYSFEDGHYDAIIVRSHEFDNYRDADWVKLPGKRGVVLAMSKDHPLASAEEFCWHNLCGETLVVVSQTESPGVYMNVMSILSLANMDTNSLNIRKVETAQDLLMDVEMGMGVAIVSANSTLTENPNIHIVEAPFADSPDGGYLAFVRHRTSANPFVSEIMRSLKALE